MPNLAGIEIIFITPQKVSRTQTFSDGYSPVLVMDSLGGLEDNAPDAGLWDAGSSEPIDVESSNQRSPEGFESTGFSAADFTERNKATQPPTSTIRKAKPTRLSVRITQIEHTKAETIVWFDVNTSLPRFRTPTYRDVRRTHNEIKRFASHLASANPECFVPALPPVTNSYPKSSPTHDQRLYADLQRWFDRVTRSPLLARDEEFLYFVESSFGYTPAVKIRPPATGLARKLLKQLQPPPDDCDELRNFRPVAKLVHQYGIESSERMRIVGKVRKRLSHSLTEFSSRLQQLMTCESQPGLINMWQKLSKVISVVSETESHKGILGDALYADGIALVADDAFIIKETLTNRHILMRDLIKAQQNSRSRHQTATRLKGATNISPARVDEAITQLEDATSIEKRVTSAVRRVTDNLVVEKQVALNRMETDILGQVAQYALRSIDCERRTLAAWESIRNDVRLADSNGGLSKLGRERTSHRSHTSQGHFEDEWSGDRHVRAKDLVPTAAAANEVLDAKRAASLLSESLF